MRQKIVMTKVAAKSRRKNTVRLKRDVENRVLRAFCW